MKVYFLLPNLSAGGAERVSITIARILSKEGFCVEFINFGYSDGEMKSWIEPEFDITNFNCRRTIKAISSLRKFMRKNPDALYFSSREHVSIVGLLCARLEKTKIVVRIPNMPKNILYRGLLGIKLKIIKSLNRFLLKNAKIIIAQNVEMKEQLLDFYKLPENKIVVINNPVDKDYIYKSAIGYKNPFISSEINFLNICNVAYSKGIDVLEKAWLIVKTEIPNAHLYIVGRITTDYAKQLIDKSKDLKDFTFLGFQSNPYPYLKYCDIFVLPSRMEGFPNVILEAMCFNKPIASTTCVSVIKDIIHEGVNGFYCDIEDANSLAECMIKASKLNNIGNNYDLFNKQTLLDCFRV
ncbi:glycosyltransferase [uncultured Parabacteroides sp.]|uniref:glycosyltransferase n=1 Tax=uncultured Parabacteroides sp. TaxID=512312 RepID=UPI002613F459|nr:glycosyltransferase [uncultured Parabacteroides sp.]